MIDSGKKIARKMHLGKGSLLLSGLDDKDAGDIAFHLAELQDDLSYLVAFGRKTGRGKHLSIEEITKLDELLRDYTHYHYISLRRSLARSTKKLREFKSKSLPGA